RTQLFSQQESFCFELLRDVWRNLLQCDAGFEIYGRVALDRRSKAFFGYSQLAGLKRMGISRAGGSQPAMGPIYGTGSRKLDAKAPLYRADFGIRLIFTWLQGRRCQSTRCNLLFEHL